MKKVLGITLLLGIASIAMAQDAERTFSYSADTAWQYIDNGGETSGTPGPWKAPTIAKVLPYLYVSGNFGGTFLVKGWGSGVSDMMLNTIEIRHNESLNIQFKGFEGTLSKQSGGTGETTPVAVKYQASLKKMDGTTDIDSKLNREGDFEKGGLDGTISGVTTTATGGKFLLQVGRQIKVTPQSGPGTYKHNTDPTITITRV